SKQGGAPSENVPESVDASANQAIPTSSNDSMITEPSLLEASTSIINMNKIAVEKFANPPSASLPDASSIFEASSAHDAVNSVDQTAVTLGTMTTSPGISPICTSSDIGPRRNYRHGRTTYSHEQKLALETAFRLTPYQDVNKRQELAKNINITPLQIMIWFKNRRVRQRMLD
ncbi:hypothetical protein PENTCL1PPCAC_4059, partial [Pristionchus entomophagus]